MSILNSKDEDERLTAILFCDRFEKLLDRIGKTKKGEQDLNDLKELAAERYGIPKKAFLAAMFAFFAFGVYDGIEVSRKLFNEHTEE